MNNKRKKRLEKISRLIEGGFDGTIGSEKHHSEIQDYLKEKNFGPDSNEESSDFYDLEKDVPVGIEDFGPGISGYKKDSLLPYSTEGMLDEDIHVYILDQSFFGENEEEHRKAIEVARFIFGPMNLGGVKVQVGTSDIETGGLRAKNKNLMNKSDLISNLSATLESHGNFGPGIDHTNYYDSEGAGSGETNPLGSSLYGLSKKEISKLPKKERDAYRLRNKNNEFKKLRKKDLGINSDGDGTSGFPDPNRFNLDYKAEKGESLVKSVEDKTYDFESEASEMLREKLSALSGKIVRFSKLKNIFAASIIHEEIPSIFKKQLGISDDNEDEDGEDVDTQIDSTEKLEEKYRHPLYVNFFEDPRYGNVEFFLNPRVDFFIDALMSQYEKEVKRLNNSRYSEEKKAEKIEKLKGKTEAFAIEKIRNKSKAIRSAILRFEQNASKNPVGLSKTKKSDHNKEILISKEKIETELKNFRGLMDSVEVLKRYFGDFEQYQIDTLEGNDSDYIKPSHYLDSEGDYDYFEEENNYDELDLSYLTEKESLGYRPNELTRKQMYPLEHLLVSIKKSKIPFALFVYDPKAGENISFSGIKHDIVHILKDPREQDKQLIKDITIPDGQEATGSQILKELNSRGNVERYDPKNYYNVGILFNGVYGVINRLAENIRTLLSEAEKGAGVDLFQYKEKLNSFDLRTFLQNKANISEEQMESRKFKHDALDFVSKYMVANYKNYTDRDVFINNVWNSDRFQDIVQHIVFSTLLKGDLKEKNIIDFELGSDDDLVRDLNSWFRLNIDPEYPMYNKPSRTNEEKWISIPGKLKDLFKNAAKGINKRALEYLNGFKDGDKNDRYTEKRRESSSEFNRQTDELLKDEDKFYKVINESSELEDSSFHSEEALQNFMKNIKSRPRLDGLIRRRLRFLSKDKDVVFCFIRLSAPPKINLDNEEEDFTSLDED